MWPTRREGWASRAVAAGAARRLCAVLATGGVLVAIAAVVAAQDNAAPPPADERATMTAREEALWRGIVILQNAAPATQPYERWFATARERREQLLARVQLYSTLYPGGAHRDEALRIELTTRYELGALHDGDLRPLCGRVSELLQAPPDPIAEAEAAYWELLCRRGASASPLGSSGQPEAGSWFSREEDLAACREYVARYPDSRYVPRLASVLFDDAYRRQDREGMRGLVEQLATRFPDHAETRAVLGVWNRVTGMGAPFVERFTTIDGQKVETEGGRGHVLLIVVWAGFDEAACRTAVAVERFRAAHAEVRVVGVSLDVDAAAAQGAAARLGLAWLQCCDGLGWGTPFVRAWGVRKVPSVFVLDTGGRLQAVAGESEWQAWAEGLLPGGHVPTSGPASGG